MMWLFDPMYLLFVSPALLLVLWAQAKVKSSYGQDMTVDARLKGAAAARYVLDRSGTTSGSRKHAAS